MRSIRPCNPATSRMARRAVRSPTTAMMGTAIETSAEMIRMTVKAANTSTPECTPRIGYTGMIA